MIPRYYDKIDPWILPKRVLIIYGPRRVGKTTLIKQYLENCSRKYRFDSGDNIRLQEIFNSSDFNAIGAYLEGYDLVVIDEAQQISGIGHALKIMVDEFPHVQVIVTGSSSLHIAQNAGEPLTGRKKELLLYPVSQLELSKTHTKYELRENLDNYLIFGSYPEVLSARSRQEKIFILRELADSYLLKDILSFEHLRNPLLLLNLLKALAFQTGNLVSLNELAIMLKINLRTVERYLNLLEKSYVICRLTPFSRNLRKELNSKSKYYFLDNGIRNAVINQFNDPSDRDDIGQLWENFMVIERQKCISYKAIHCNQYFWRTYSGSEIDLIEESDGKIKAFEFKYSKESTQPPKDFVNNYQNADFTIINRSNYLDFIT